MFASKDRQASQAKRLDRVMYSSEPIQSGEWPDQASFVLDWL